MAGFARLLFALALLPFAWGIARALWDCVCISAGHAGGISAESISLLGGIAAFSLSWAAVSRPVRAYVLGHELTHALWGLMFGAWPSKLRVGAGGGSVQLTKSNFLITLAPYFFPFYTFVVLVAALVTYAFVRPLPFLPLWTFMVGFTWAFHVLFTLETLSRRQPDVKLYGRLFSWTLIFSANAALVLAWLAATTSLGFGEMAGAVAGRAASAYASAASAFAWCARALAGMFRGNGG